MTYSSYALLLLLSVNLLNYMDRQVLYAVFPLIKVDLQLSDAALGFLGSAFMLCYMFSAPLFGWLGDRRSRVKLASIGLTLWSLATAAAGFAAGYGTLLSARTGVGVGEASFGTVSPGLLSDYFPKAKRGRILSYFYLAIPVGSALGYLLGGILGQYLGWHAVFLIASIPGIILSFPLWFLREPPRGATEEKTLPPFVLKGKNYISLFRNRSFVFNTLSMAAMTFALGGLAQWVPMFLYRIHGLDVARANTLFGLITVIAGITGTLTGGWLGDRLQKRSDSGYLKVAGWGFLLGTPVSIYALITPSLPECLTAISVAEFFLFLNTGPLNTVILNVTAPSVRAMAFAVNIFFIHALGDAVSPTILGLLSDHWGLRTSLLLTPIAILLAALLTLICGRFIEKDSAGPNHARFTKLKPPPE